MKITPEHVEWMRQEIAPMDTDINRQRYRDGDFPRADKVNDLNKRYRWDLFYAANVSNYIVELYGMNIKDDHIDTALRSIVKAL